METGCVMLLTTLGADADWQGLAQRLVEERLAACVNVLSPMESVYRWKGNVEREQERLLLVKTSLDRLPSLQARLLELHPFEVPEVVVLPIIGGTEAYLGWVRDSTAP